MYKKHQTNIVSCLYKFRFGMKYLNGVFRQLEVQLINGLSRICVIGKNKLVNVIKSNLLTISPGAPQGFLLGPLLFLTFNNAFPNSSQLFKSILFADYSTITVFFSRNDNTSADKTISELVSVNNCFDTNKLCINIDKIKFMSFSYRSKPDSPFIKICNYNISKEEKIKFLGMCLDRLLTFKNHVDCI